MSFQLSTLHIFAHGETQIIGSDSGARVNKKVPNSALTKLNAVVNNVYSKKPADNTSPNQYRVITVFNKQFADYQAKDFPNWRVQWDDLDKTAIDELVAEVLATPVSVIPLGQ